MSGRVQGQSGRAALAGPFARLAAVLLSLFAAACAGGATIEQLAADSTITTASIRTNARNEPTKEEGSDAVTIRNAVSSADIEMLGGAPLPWTNPLTGSRGAITAISDMRGDGGLCRSFTATRESYDGVTVLKGEACMDGSGTWSMRRFQPVG